MHRKWGPSQAEDWELCVPTISFLHWNCDLSQDTAVSQAWGNQSPIGKVHLVMKGPRWWNILERRQAGDWYYAIANFMKSTSKSERPFISGLKITQEPNLPSVTAVCSSFMLKSFLLRLKISSCSLWDWCVKWESILSLVPILHQGLARSIVVGL